MTTDEPRYWLLDAGRDEDTSKSNRLNEVAQETQFPTTGLVDERTGGVIAYIHAGEAEAICNTLNGDSCGCLNGILWPWGTNSDFSHDWIERCDECAIYENDEQAAFALAERFGCSVTFSRVESLDRLAPHIDLPRAPALAS